MIETIKYKDRVYPKLQSEGNAAQYAIPFAKQILKYCQTGFDIGCNRKEWAYPGAIPIDPLLCGWDAMNLPKDVKPEYIFSSHMLEHYQGAWVEVLEYWKERLCKNGILFLYLPHYDQKYWRSWNNKKHVHNFTPNILRDYFNDSEGWKDVFVTDGYDLNHSFYAIASKQ